MLTLANKFLHGKELEEEQRFTEEVKAAYEAEKRKSIAVIEDKLTDAPAPKTLAYNEIFADENILFESKNNNYTIIRPYISYSDYRLQLGVFEKEKWLIRAIQDNTIVVSADILLHRTTMTYAKDVANRIACIVGCSKSRGEIYNIANNKSCTWREILDQYF